MPIMLTALKHELKVVAKQIRKMGGKEKIDKRHYLLKCG